MSERTGLYDVSGRKKCAECRQVGGPAGQMPTPAEAHLRRAFKPADSQLTPPSHHGAVDGLPVRFDYARKGGHRVVFHRRVAPDAWPATPTPQYVASTGGETPLAVTELIDCA